MEQAALIPHLFRTEFAKITAVLCRLFGIEHLEMAEDIASETFLAALETWSYKGIPPSPTAWLYTVAKNKARNQLKRMRLFEGRVASELQHQSARAEEINIDLSEANISDSQLQMLFAVCHPSISAEAQIGLALRVLCGFGIEEIANALLSNKETVAKRLTRAKEKLRTEKVVLALPSGPETGGRLRNVLTALYLLFNEGYYSESSDRTIREELCMEAMRLTALLTANSQTNLSEVHALLSLMCFQASRLAARKDKDGEMILYDDQDETLWNKALIARGAYHLHLASTGETFSQYHLEAGIAYYHTIKEDTPDKWENILQLYNRLLQIHYSPVAALNRTYALARARSNTLAIEEAEKLQLIDNHFYFLLLGELYRDVDGKKSVDLFNKALQLAKTKTDKRTIRAKIARA